MKSFKQIRERRSPQKVKGKQVFNSKVKGVQVSVIKDKNKFVVHIDGEELDSYTSLGQAKRMGTEFAKEVGK